MTNNFADYKKTETEKVDPDSALRILSFAIEQSPVTTVITDLSGNIVFANPKFTETTGYTLEEAIGKNPRILNTGHTPSSEYAILWNTILSGQNWHGIFQNKKKNGELYWESAVISPVKDKEGNITHFLAVKEDITERKRIEDELKENASELEIFNQQLEKAIAQANEMAVQAVQAEAMIRERENDLNEAQRLAHVGSWRYDFATGNTTWSLEMFRIFGRDPLHGVPSWYEMRRIIHSDDWQSFISALRSATTDGKPYELEIRAKYADGSILWLLLNGGKVPEESRWVSGTIQDITARKRAEEVLRESEVRFKSAFQYSAIGMAFISPQGKWLKVNSRICEIVGYSEVELLTKTFQDITHPDDLTADLDQVRQMLAGEIETYKMEKRYIHKKGHFVWVLLAVSLVKDGDGTPLYFISQIEDITERKRIEKFSEVLYEISKAVYLTANVNELFKSIHNILLEVIAGNNFYIALLANNGRTLSFPYSKDEIDHGDWPNIDVDDSLSLTAEVLNLKQPLFLNETQLHDRYLKGWDKVTLGTRPKCWLGIPLLIKGKAIGIMAIQDYHNSAAYSHEDVTLLELAASQIAIAVERKQSEDALRASEERYRAVFDSASDAIISADGAGNIVDWNLGAARIFGYSEDEVQGQPITMLLPERYQAEHLTGMARIQANGEKHVIGKTVELEGRRSDGCEFPLEISLSEWQVDGKTAFAAVIRDITERKRLKEALQQQASTDELTGTFNRRHFQQLAHSELKRAARLNHPLAIVLIDIDHFKAVNDTLGHAAGDQVLLAFTKICQRNIREIDVFARFGGDEFALLLPEANPQQAFTVIERMRMAITAQSIDLDGNLVSISISSGISNLSNEDETFDNLLSQADQALYRAKETGRNNVVQYVEL